MNPALEALAVAGIEAAKIASLAVLGSLLAFSAAYFGVKQLLKLFNSELKNELPGLGDESFSNIEASRMRANERASSRSGLTEFDNEYMGNRGFFPELDSDFADTQPLSIGSAGLEDAQQHPNDCDPLPAIDGYLLGGSYVCNSCNEPFDSPIYNDHFVDYDNPYPGDILPVDDGVPLSPCCHTEDITHVH
jgi:hypothetical protein